MAEPIAAILKLRPKKNGRLPTAWAATLPAQLAALTPAATIGLLVAVLHPPVQRTVLVAKIDALAEYGNNTFMGHTLITRLLCQGVERG